MSPLPTRNCGEEHELIAFGQGELTPVPMYQVAIAKDHQVRGNVPFRRKKHVSQVRSMAVRHLFECFA
jgi:hypothetical protein